MTTATTSVSVWNGQEWPSDGTEEYEAIPGDIKLVSAVHTMEGASKHVGQFHHSDRGGERAFTETLEVIPLMVRTNRAFFEAGSKTPLCRSNDGKHIDPGQPLWQRESVVVKAATPAVAVPQQEPRGCESCPFSRWEGNVDPPLCQEGKVLFMIREDDDTPARYRFTGVAIKPLTKFIRQEVISARRPLYSWRLTISSTEVQRGGKKFFEPKLSGTDLTLDEARGYAQIVEQQRRRFEMPENEDAEFEAPASAATPVYDNVADAADFTEFWKLMDSLELGKVEIRADVTAILHPGKVGDLQPMDWVVLMDDLLSAVGQTTLKGLTAPQRKQMVLVVRAERLKREASEQPFD